MISKSQSELLSTPLAVGASQSSGCSAKEAAGNPQDVGEKSAWQKWDQHTGEVLLTAAQVDQIIVELADKVAANHKSDPRPLVVVSILKGGVFPGVELVKLLGARGVACRIDFIWYESYSGTSSTGTVKKLADLQTEIEGENVLLVDDLIDTGLTLATAHANLLSRKPAKLETCVLLEKMGVARNPLAAKLECEYIGYKIPNKFIIGAFMDFNEHFRSNGDIVVFKKGEKSHLCNVGIVSQRPTPFQRMQELRGEGARTRSRSRSKSLQ